MPIRLTINYLSQQHHSRQQPQARKKSQYGAMRISHLA